jgi:hypothetical protein
MIQEDCRGISKTMPQIFKFTARILVKERTLNYFDKSRVQNRKNSYYFVPTHDMKEHVTVVEQLHSLLTL